MSSVFPGVDHLDRLIGGGRVSDDQALAVLYVTHFPSLVRLAMLLVDDVPVKVSLSRDRLRDPNAGLAPLEAVDGCPGDGVEIGNSPVGVAA